MLTGDWLELGRCLDGWGRESDGEAVPPFSVSDKTPISICPEAKATGMKRSGTVAGFWEESGNLRPTLMRKGKGVQAGPWILES